MPEAVYTRNKRFQWVTKDISEVGDNTPFPIEITGADFEEKLDKLAEIFHRTNIAQITSNGLSYAVPINFGVTSGTVSPRVMYSASGGLADNFLTTGYTTLDDVSIPFEVDASAVPYLTDQYSETYESSPGVGTLGVHRDTNGRERGLLLPTGDGGAPLWNRPDIDSVVTAFTWRSYSASGTATQPPIPIPWVDDGAGVYETFELTVATQGSVAVVYGGAEGNLFHPDNRFFLEISVEGSVPGVSLFFKSGEITGGYSSTSAVYTMRLSSGDLTCPLCATDASLTGSLVHEAVEWFPYADADGPVWDSVTGEEIPNGAEPADIEEFIIFP